MKYCLIGGVILLILFLAYQSCNLHDKASELKGQYDALKIIADEDKEAYLKTIKIKTTLISQLAEKIGQLNSDVLDKYDEINNKNTELSKLEEEIATLEDKDGVIRNLTAQIEIWKEKFSLAEKIIVDKDKIIFTLTEKYEAQLVISDSYKEMYFNEQGLHGLAIERLRIADRRLKTLRFGGSIKTVLIAGLGGLLIIKIAR